MTYNTSFNRRLSCYAKPLMTTVSTVTLHLQTSTLCFVYFVLRSCKMSVHFSCILTRLVAMSSPLNWVFHPNTPFCTHFICIFLFYLPFIQYCFHPKNWRHLWANCQRLKQSIKKKILFLFLPSFCSVLLSPKKWKTFVCHLHNQGLQQSHSLNYVKQCRSFGLQ